MYRPGPGTAWTAACADSLVMVIYQIVLTSQISRARNERRLNGLVSAPGIPGLPQVCLTLWRLYLLQARQTATSIPWASHGEKTYYRPFS